MPVAPSGRQQLKGAECSLFKREIQSFVYKEVKRQKGESGILKAATKIRKSISSGFFNDFHLISNNKDIFNLSNNSFLETWQNASSPKIIIASKNKTCLNLNLQIRERIFGKPDLPIQKGDIVTIGSNNYVKGVFNGEFAVVNNVCIDVTKRDIPLKGRGIVTLSWRNIELIFPDSENGSKVVEGKMLENFLYGETSLRPEEIQALRVDFKIENPNLKNNTIEYHEAILKDEFYNCLLIKYGYAVTCHKAQGGEWGNVFTIWDHDNSLNFDFSNSKQSKAGKTNQDFYRWAYTAITRASKTLYALNPPIFNSYSNMAFVDSAALNALNSLSKTIADEEEISLDNELLQQLTNLQLLDQAIPLQDHFVKVRHEVRKHYIEIVGWEKIGYEIRYTFQRENTKAVFRTSVNGQNEFKNPFAPMLKLSLNDEFNQQLVSIFTHLPNVVIKRNTVETIVGKIEFDFDLEEQFPFIVSFYDDIVLKLGKLGVIIKEIEHLSYRERYFFKRNQETATLDFIYNADGFWSRVETILNMTNSQKLVTEIQTLIQSFKKDFHAS